MSKLPNLVIFNPDQWRGDVLHHAGNPAVRTPNLDRLVQSEAVSFVNAFCQNPVCTPSRCSFMTGWYPHVRGHRTMHHPLQPDEPCLLRELRRAGYYVWWGGKNDLVTDPEAFAECCDYRHRAQPSHGDLHGSASDWRATVNGKPDHSFYAGKLEKAVGEEVYLDPDWANVRAAEQFIRTYTGDAPFCLYLPLAYPHPPYGVEEPFFSRTDRAALPPRIRSAALEGKPRMHAELRAALELEGRPESWWDELRGTYYGMCSRVDAQFGELLDTLRQSGKFDDTAVFFFSDHGDFTGDYDLVEKAQNLFDDCLVHVPFVFKPPGTRGMVPGIRTGLVELVDFPATVYHLLDIEPGYTHFGRSLLPLLEEDRPHREHVFAAGGRLAAEDHCREAQALERGGFSLYAPRVKIQADDPVAHGKAVMCRDRRYKLVMRLYEPDEFYDLSVDPGETRNRVDDPGYAAERARLQAAISRFFLETTDVVPWKHHPRDV